MRSLFRSFGALLAGLALVSVAGEADAKSQSKWKLNGGYRMEQGSGELATETRTLESFNKIENLTSMDIVVTIGQTQSVSITIDDNLLNNIELKVSGGTLEIDSRGSYSSEEGGIISIVVPELDEIENAGSGTIRVENLKARHFTFRLSGSGESEFAGTVGELEIFLDGSGNVDTRRLEAKSAIVEINGSGTARVFASDILDGEVNGSGDIFVYGNPRKLREDVSGSGNIRMRN